MYTSVTGDRPQKSAMTQVRSKQQMPDAHVHIWGKGEALEPTRHVVPVVVASVPLQLNDFVGETPISAAIKPMLLIPRFRLDQSPLGVVKAV